MVTSHGCRALLSTHFWWDTIWESLHAGWQNPQQPMSFQTAAKRKLLVSFSSLAADCQPELSPSGSLAALIGSTLRRRPSVSNHCWYAGGSLQSRITIFPIKIVIFLAKNGTG